MLLICHFSRGNKEIYSNEGKLIHAFISKAFEPAHEIMARFILRKLILQMHMRSHQVGLDVWFLVSPYVFFHTSCVQTLKGLARLRKCAGSPESLLVAFVISTMISWVSSFKLTERWVYEAPSWFVKNSTSSMTQTCDFVTRGQEHWTLGWANAWIMD